MATKLQCKSYLPGYSSMRDLNEDSNSCSWPLYYGEKVLTTNGQYYNGFLPKAIADGYSEYDKDLLKRTMIEHEGIFKKQVYELHRLYRIQRNLMDELKRNDRHKKNTEASLSSSPLVSQVSSEDARKWHTSMANSVCARSSISAVEDNVSPISSRKADCCVQIRQFPSQNTEVEALDSRRPTKMRRKSIDLHLPADEYIYTNRVPKTEPLSGEKPLIYETRKSYGNGDVLKSGSCLRSFDGLGDLNDEPVQVEETDTSRCTYNMRHASFYEEIQGRGLPAGKTRGILGLPEKMGSASNHVRDQGRLNHLQLEDNGRETGWFSHVHGSGNSKISEHSVHQSYQSEKFQVMPWENRSSNLDHELKIPVQTTPFLKSSLSLKNCSQPLPPRDGIHGDMWLPNQNVVKHRYDDNISSEEVLKKNDSEKKLQKGSNGVEMVSLRNMNLNVPLSDESGNLPMDNLAVLPWLAGKSSCNKETANLPMDLNVDGLSLLNNTCIRNSKSVSYSNNVEMGRNERILGFSVSKDYPSHISTSVSAPRLSENEEKRGKHQIDLDINLPCVPESEHVTEEDSVVEKGSDSIFSGGSRHQIDLNICVSEVDDSFTPRIPITDNKGNAGIDLEVPAIPEIDCEELLNSPCTVEHDDDDDDDDDDLSRIAAEAIVAISAFESQSSFDEEESGSGSGSSEASAADPFNWFVDIIDSCGSLERKLSNIISRRNDDSPPIDFFEYMTLKLSETTEEEYMPKPLIPESLKLDETTDGGGGGGGGGQLRNQPRRGNARRGRQRRDFQRDILPGLVSLSRHEVTEDLQTFGGLMKAATGQTWQTGSARRNGCKRGRRRLRNSPSPSSSSFRCHAMVATAACVSLVQEFSNVEAGVEDRSLTGWGKTTRRPRRQRCPAGNISTVGLS